uniref:Uncharacterized protein n=1 Tax=Glossina palpalis gambiensis TaxID=67801 RepID=A0A1B0AWT4_9MUSC
MAREKSFVDYMILSPWNKSSKCYYRLKELERNNCLKNVKSMCLLVLLTTHGVVCGGTAVSQAFHHHRLYKYVGMYVLMYIYLYESIHALHTTDKGYKIVFSTHHCHVMKSVIELITLYSVFSRNDDDDGNKKRGCPQFQIQICEIKMGDTTTSTQY